MSKQIALIVDDEADIRSLVSITLERMGLECYAAANVKEAISLLQQRTYNFCITDMKLPDGNGLELIRYCQKNHPAMPIAMITAYGNLELGVHALKAGAFDVVAKPIDTERLRILVRDALKLSQTPQHIQNLPSDVGLLGESLVVSQLRTDMAQVARTQAPVFIQGETGTGKELMARLIHHQSSQSNQNFIVVKCSGVSEEELEERLFSPQDPKQGALYQANKGTLYIQDIDFLSLELQAKLLHFLQEKVIVLPALGVSQKLNIRMIASSSRSLQDLMQERKFRQDLYYRVSVINLDAPALKERGDDIELLTKHFIKKYSKEWGGPELTIDKEAIKALRNYPFPGNIDELQAILQRAVSLAETDGIKLEDLRLNEQVAEQQRELPKVVTNNLSEYLENIERAALVHALETTKWNKTAAAAKLGISFRTMRYRCTKLGIDQ